MVTQAVTGGAALSLLESKVTHDKGGFEYVLASFPIEEIVSSAVTLAVHLAGRAAHGFIDETTGELAANNPDDGVTYALRVALEEGDAFDDPDVARSGRVYIARDQFLGSLIATTSTWDGEYRPQVAIHFFAGWNTTEWSEQVAMGVTLALEAIMFLDVMTSLNDQPTDADIHAAQTARFDSYRRSVARSFA